jgi:hypothetical protein
LGVKVTFDRSVLGVSCQQNPFYGKIIHLWLRRRRLKENNQISDSSCSISPITLDMESALGTHYTNVLDVALKECVRLYSVPVYYFT